MHLHIDCQFGVAGDMLLAALVDAGADHDAIVRALSEIPLEQFALECKRVTRGGIAAMLADVRDTSGNDRTAYGRPAGHPHDPNHAHAHPHDHPHGHDHPQEHPHASGGPHRHLSDLLALLDCAAVPARARARAEKAFRLMAAAEAAVHGETVENVHFHEISGIDTAVDVIGSCLALEQLGIDSISSSAPTVGSGMLVCEHGIFPVPAPATLEILKANNIPWRSGGEGERATPTGIALLAGIADRYGDSPEITVTRIGYGAGHREFGDSPNLLRAIIGKPAAAASAEAAGFSGHAGFERPGGGKTIITEALPEVSAQVVPSPAGDMLPEKIQAMVSEDALVDGDRVVEFRFVVDDMTAEAVAFLCERCLAHGAVEAYAVPAMMKKSRAGHELTVLAAPDFAPAVADAIWRESTTFGMRVGERSRLILSREIRRVDVLGHGIRVKLGWRGGVLVRRQPEYEDCRVCALAAGRSLLEVFALAEREALRFS